MTDRFNIYLYSKRYIDIMVRLVLVFIIIGLLVGFSIVLYFVTKRSALKICLIMLFTLLFVVALNIYIKVKRYKMHVAIVM